MKHTALKWYDDEIDRLVSMLICNQLSISRYNKLKNEAYEQAKEMEKEQIIKAYEITKFGIFAMTDTGILDTANKSGEQYYNETFKSE